MSAWTKNVMDPQANPRLSLLANLRVLKNFGHTCLLKSLPRHLLDATGCSICSGAAVNCINFWIRTLSPPCSSEGFWRQDLKTFFKSNSIILLPPQLRLGYLVIHHKHEKDGKSFSFVWTVKTENRKNPCLSWCSIWRSYLYCDVQRLKFCMRQCQNAVESLMIDVFISIL